MINYDKLCMSDVMNKLIELIVGKITKKEIMVKLLFIIFIFTSYMYIRPYSFETLGDYAKYLITPVILSLFVLIIRENIIYFFNFLIFLLIIYAESTIFKSISKSSNLKYATLIIFITLFMLVLDYLFYKRYKIGNLLKLIKLTIITLPPLVVVVYYIIYKSFFSKDVIYAIAQTNSSEVFEYFKRELGVWSIIIILISFVIILMITLKVEARKITTPKRYIMLCIIMGILSISKVQDYKLYEYLVTGAQDYKKELEMFKNMQEKRKSGEIKFNALKEEKDEVYIVIIGESLNKNHMNLYGYPRKTTPNISKLKEKNEILVYKKAHSNHVQTMPTLSLVLTEANLINKKDYFNSLSLLDIYNRANVETNWLTNQNLIGVWGNLVTIIAKTAKNLVAINKSIGEDTATQNYDGLLIKKLEKNLKLNNENKIIFMHLMGSHGSYKERYPDNFEKFKEIKKEELGEQKYKDVINKYDNTVYYNDYVVSSIIKELKNQNKVAGLIYFSDHGEAVTEDLGHNSSNFRFNMTQIPMIIWLSDKYKERYPEKTKNLENHRNTMFSNDFIYDTVLGITNVKTDRYEERFDLSSKNYSFKPEEAKLLYGKYNYTDPKNYFYWQKSNVEKLQKEKLLEKLVISNTQTQLKLRNSEYDEIRTYEIRTKFDGKKLKVGNIEFKEFISVLKNKEKDNFVLDVENLSSSNYNSIINYIKSLGIDKNTSLIIPENIDILSDKDVKSLFKITSNSNLDKLDKKNILYLNLEDYLKVKKKLPLEAKYIISTDLDISKPEFLEELKKSKLLEEKQVEKIIINYKGYLLGN